MSIRPAGKVLLVNVRGHHPHTNFSPPIGLLYLVSYLREVLPQIEVDVLDQKVTSLSDEAVAEQAVSGGYAIVGLSTFSMLATDAESIARLVKLRRPDTIIVMGGPHPSAFPPDALADPAVDYAIRGEGEVAFAALVRRLLDTDPVADLPGVVRRDGDTTIVGPEPAVVENPDDLPFPAWDAIRDWRPYWRRQGFALMGHRPYMGIFTSRACPYQCTYCHNIFGKRFRPRSPANIVAEMVAIHRRFGLDEFEFLDDAFNLQEDRALEILDRVRTTLPRARLLFPNGLRADIMTPRLIDAMARAGTYYVSVAIESASPRIQKLIRKNLDIDAVEENIRRCSDRRIYCNGYFMLGFPTETLDEMRRTVDFAVHSWLHSASFFRVVPFKGTALWESLDYATRARLAALPANEHTYFRYAINLSAASETDFLKLHRQAFLRFYTRPTRIMRVFRDHPRPFQAVASFANLFVRRSLIDPARVRLRHPAPVCGAGDEPA